MRRFGWVILGLPLVLTAPPRAVAEAIRFMELPPLRWTPDLSRDEGNRRSGPAALAARTGGIAFGQSPSEVNTHLASPLPGIDWGGLPSAREYPGDVRYFWARLDALKLTGAVAGGTGGGITGGTAEGIAGGLEGACAGAESYVVFLFQKASLFRISFRLLADQTCPSPAAAAAALQARFLAADSDSSLTLHYRPNKADVVDICDPSAGFLIPYRWENRGRR